MIATTETTNAMLTLFPVYANFPVVNDAASISFPSLLYTSTEPGLNTL